MLNRCNESFKVRRYVRWFCRKYPNAAANCTKENAAFGAPVVVVSAMGGVTNLLAQMAEKASAGEEYANYLAELETRHFTIIKTLLDVQRQNPVFTKLKIFFNELEDLLQGISSLKELTAQTRDLVLSYGERCSAFMISKIAEQFFLDRLCGCHAID